MITIACIILIVWTAQMPLGVSIVTTIILGTKLLLLFIKNLLQIEMNIKYNKNNKNDTDTRL